VIFGEGEDLSLATAWETEPATEHEAFLLGLPASTEGSFQVLARDGDLEGESGVETFTTGALSSALPSLTVEGAGMDHNLVVPILGDPVGLVILDPQGRYVWWTYDDSGLDVYRALLSRDGQSVLYNQADISNPSPDSAIIRAALDGSSTERIPVPYLAHDFVEHPDGTLGAIAVEYRDDVKGDAIVEIAPDGTLTTVWTSWDCFDPKTDIGDDQEYGWTWANALDYDPATDDYYISLRNFSTVLQVHGDGGCGWAFGSVGATIEPGSGSARFLHSHQFEVSPGRFLVFDNDGATAQESRVLEYDFDPDQGTADQIWEYSADPSVFSFVLGDVHRFDDGDTLVTWSVNGLIQRVSPAGEVEFEITSPFGHAFGFDTVRADLYAQDD
jgi:hypothetical protein